MSTTYENMVLNETFKREGASKRNWGTNNCGDTMIFPMETVEFGKLEGLKEQVADLCDLQPTQASMKRPPRKVRSPRPARMWHRTCAHLALTSHVSGHSAVAGGAAKTQRRARLVARRCGGAAGAAGRLGQHRLEIYRAERGYRQIRQIRCERAVGRRGGVELRHALLLHLRS
jgi:hypothetical protein